MRTEIWWIVSATLALLVAVGCQKSGSGPAASTTTGDAAAGSTASDKGADAESSAAVKLDIAPWAEVEKYVADHKGKVVVLDLWSTSCQPCVRELPGLVKLHQEHPGDVVCVTCSLDYYGAQDEPPESYKDQALKVLTAKGATFQNYLSSDKDELVYEKVGTNPVPIVLVYDRAGKLAKRFDKEFTYEKDVAPLVKELLTSSTGS